SSGRRPGKGAWSKTRQKVRDATAEVERALAGRSARLLGIDRGEQLLHAACRRRAERLVEMDRLGELLAHEIVTPRQLAIAGKGPLHAIGIAPAQRSRCMPRQQGLDVIAFRVFA